MTEKVIVITTENKISIRDIEVNDGSMLQGLWDAVGGFIEIVRPVGLEYPLVLLCDEEGLLKGKEINIVGSVLYGMHEHGNPIVGDIVVLQEGFRDGEPDIIGIPEDACRDVYNALKNNFAFLEGDDQ